MDNAHKHKYFAVYKSGIVTALTYKPDYLIGYLMQFIYFFVNIALWSAIANASQTQAMTQQQVIAYFCTGLIVKLMTDCVSRVSAMIRQGDLSFHITRPYNVVLYEMTTILAEKTCEFTRNIPFFLFVLVWYFPMLDFSGVSVYAPIFLVLGFLISYLFSLLINLLSFWFVDISGFQNFLKEFLIAINGQMIPYQFMPGIVLGILNWLPFQFVMYYPIALLTGAAPQAEIPAKLALAIGYCVLLGLACYALYRRGLKRYTAAGG